MSSIKKVAIIGTGVIGTGWIIRCLAHNKIVYAFDKDLKLKKNLISEFTPFPQSALSRSLKMKTILDFDFWTNLKKKIIKVS